MPDSTATTKDLHTGELSPSVGWSDTFISCTDILNIAHSNIPPPHDEGQVFTTSIPDRPPVLESTNRYDVLQDLTNESLDIKNDPSSASTDEAEPRAESPLKTTK